MDNFLSNYNWSSVLSATATNVEVAVYEFNKIMMYAFDLFVPIVKVRWSDGSPKWLPRELKILKNRKSRLHKRLKAMEKKMTDGLFVDSRVFNAARAEFCDIRETLNQELKNQYNLYLNDLKDNIRVDPSKFWKHVKSKKGGSAFPKTMSFNDVSSSNESEICDMFADFFQNVYKQDNCDPTSSNVPDFTQSAVINLPEIKTNDVIDSINRLKSSFTPGPDNIPSCVLKNCCESLSHILIYL